MNLKPLYDDKFSLEVDSGELSLLKTGLTALLEKTSDLMYLTDSRTKLNEMLEEQHSLVLNMEQEIARALQDNNDDIPF